MLLSAIVPINFRDCLLGCRYAGNLHFQDTFRYRQSIRGSHQRELLDPDGEDDLVFALVDSPFSIRL